MNNPQYEFVLQTMFGPMASGKSGLAAYITYGEEIHRSTEPHIHVCASGFFGKGNGTAALALSACPAEIEGIPFFFGRPLIEQHGVNLVVHADLIASAYYLLARCEEMSRRDVRDKHGRFSGRESLPYRAGFLNRPIVDEYAALFRKWLRRVGVECEEPPARIRRILLTHDVDAPRLYPSWKAALKASGKALIYSKKLHVEPFLCRLGLRRDPYDTFDAILKHDLGLKNRCGVDQVKILFFFLARAGGIHEARYDIRAPRIQELIHKLKQQGADIGLHVSYAAGANPALIAGEKRRLEVACGFEITASRHHFLRFCEPEHIRYLEAAGITDDYSMGYADISGFRLGTCRPFRAVDPERGCFTGVTFHPLTAMDCTLDDPRYMGLDLEQAKHHSGGLLQQVARHNGEAVLLWHNTEFAPSNGNYHPALYEEVTRLCGNLA